MQFLWIFFGLLIVFLTFWDFFHTTVSGNGFGMISLKINEGIAKIILKLNSKTLFHYSGFIHVMIHVFSLFFLLLVGTFLIFMSGSEMVVHEMTNIPATTAERFYYTCYLLSTAGFGDFVPGTNLSKFFSAIFSFSGFVLLTTAMTYLISVINSVLKKKELALYISSLGENLNDLYFYFTIDPTLKMLTEQSGNLRQLIHINTSNLNTFPIIRYFLTRKKKSALVLQLASLHEVLTILKKNMRSDSSQYLKINNILKSIVYYLELEKETPLTFRYNKEKLNKLRGFWQTHDQAYPNNTSKDKALSNVLQKAGWEWEAIYVQKS